MEYKLITTLKYSNEITATVTVTNKNYKYSNKRRYLICPTVFLSMLRTL